jgi:hypothetical protein
MKFVYKHENTSSQVGALEDIDSANSRWSLWW